MVNWFTARARNTGTRSPYAPRTEAIMSPGSIFFATEPFFPAMHPQLPALETLGEGAEELFIVVNSY